jgi:hypothetical protein
MSVGEALARGLNVVFFDKRAPDKRIILDLMTGAESTDPLWPDTGNRVITVAFKTPH